MTQQIEPELSPTAASFAAHLREFHRGLPPEEQQLLEEVLALADRGMQDDDTRGLAMGRLLALGDIRGESSGERHKEWIEVLSFSSMLRPPGSVQR